VGKRVAHGLPGERGCRQGCHCGHSF
jgi:hypothetical protein